MSKMKNPVDFILDRMVEAALGEGAHFTSHARALNVPANTIRTWKRRGKVPLHELEDYSQRYGRSIDWFLNGDKPMLSLVKPGEARVESPSAAYGALNLPEDFVLVPRYDVRAGAGGGQLIHDDAVVDHLAFKREWIVGSLDLEPRRVALIEVHGDSMQPTLNDGDLILVDLRNGHMRRAGVYVIQHSSHLLVKRLATRIDGGVDVISDNPAYGTERLSREAADSLTVVGRVVWSGGKI